MQQPTVWLLVYGDEYDMTVGDIKGVYTAPELARAQFDAYAERLNAGSNRGLDEEDQVHQSMADARTLDDGSLYLSSATSASDRVALIPSPLTGPLTDLARS